MNKRSSVQNASGFGLVLVLVGIATVCALIALGLLIYRNQNKSVISYKPVISHVLVWAVDDTVNIPSSLESYLEVHDQYDCRGYRGTGTPTGKALFAVQKSYDDSYAILAYGCGDNVQSDAVEVAIKVNGTWQFPKDYFDGGIGSAPLCTQLTKYHISKQAESSCVDDHHNVTNNTIP